MKTSYWMGSISTTQSGPSRLVRLFDLLLGWIERGQQRRALGRLDERLLSDIGVDRATAKAEADKPLWRD
ncbi:MAG: DUF1127 domain-containing protein [Rhodospirillaceae bacterium]|nr:DUF1127 domain-containing protein [Rhodospirillales bacterium]